MAHLIGAQEGDKSAHFFSARHAAERDRGDDALDVRFRHADIGHLGLGETRRHREGKDVLRCITARDGLGQRHQSAFRGGIGPLIGRVAAMGGAARDVDDLAAALLAEMRHRQLA